jgi:hypothetical protein
MDMVLIGILNMTWGRFAYGVQACNLEVMINNQLSFSIQFLLTFSIVLIL